MPGRPGPFDNLTRFPKLTTMRTFFRRKSFGPAGLKPGLVNFLYQFSHRLHEVKRIRKPVYAAAGLLLLSAGLTFLVVSSLSQNIRPLPPLAEKNQPAEQRMKMEQTPAATPLIPSVPAQLPVPAAKEAAPLAAGGQAVEQSIPSAAVSNQEQHRQPLTGTLAADFGWQHHAVYQDWRFHTGIDIAGTPGQPVRAAAGGRVVDVLTDNQLGLMLVIESSGYTLYYGSLSSAAVKAGQTVHSGDVIGVVGECTGEPFTHLHFAVKKQGEYIHPQEFLK